MGGVDAVWKNISENSCQSLFESMPSRVLALIKARGGHTRYLDYAHKNSTWSPDGKISASCTNRYYYCENPHFITRNMT